MTTTTTISDSNAAKLILQLMPRIQFNGGELQALAALQNWALDRSGAVPGTPKTNGAEHQMTLPLGEVN